MKKILFLILLIAVSILIIAGFLLFSGTERLECMKAGGTWRTTSGCGDNCEPQRNPGQILCAGVEYEDCVCGLDKCWNGYTCESL